MRFKDREHAGELLAEQLRAEWKERSPVIVALPRGGVPVARPIARVLDAPLEILLVRKLGAPGNPEYALGAIAEDGEVWLNQQAISALGPDRALLEEAAAEGVREMERQDRIFREGRAAIAVKGRPVILVDDGLATGATMLVAVASMRAKGASEVAVAVPVASNEAMRLVKDAADALYVAFHPSRLRSVGEWYDRFDQVTDKEVSEVLLACSESVRGQVIRREVEIELDGAKLAGELTRPEGCKGWVIFAHGSGSGRKSPRNTHVARALNEAGFGTLLFDLLTTDEARDPGNVFAIDLLARRLAGAADWLRARPESKGLCMSFYGASTGAAAALQACARFHPDLFGILSRGGRPDLAMKCLPDVHVPVLLVVGGEDHPVIELNLKAHEVLPCSKVEIVPGAGHLFEEPGALEQVTELAIRFFQRALDKHKERHHVA